MKKVNWFVVLAGGAVGLAAVLLTAFGNPANMGFCIACFLRDIVGACGMHSAAVVQYVRPEIVGLVLGAFIMSVATKEFRAKAGSSPAVRLLAMALGLLTCYIFGTVWFWVLYAPSDTTISLILMKCVLPYLLPDAIKLLLSWQLSGRLSKFIN